MKQLSDWENNKGINFLRKVGIKKDYKVLDFGCNNGNYSIPASKIVGENPRGQGDGRGQGKGVGRGKGRGRGGCPVICFCPNCGKELPHTPGVPCNSIKCPQCGNLMTRKN